jgi:uncharacterized C2H2 Zn-finger protein
MYENFWRCPKDRTVFEAEPVPYPRPGRQSKHNCADGDKFIECPTCGRRYFYYDHYEWSDMAGFIPKGYTGYVSDRPLESVLPPGLQRSNKYSPRC